MELEKLKRDEIKSFDMAKAGEVETDIRRQLHSIRMNITEDSKKFVGKVRSLKKNLARIKTHQHELALAGKK